jgi:hypothetical protein
MKYCFFKAFNTHILSAWETILSENQYFWLGLRVGRLKMDGGNDLGGGRICSGVDDSGENLFFFIVTLSNIDTDTGSSVRK